MTTLRMNKALAAAGLCSRRKADELIRSGAVALNGVTVSEPGVCLDPDLDRLSVNGRDIDLGAGLASHTYIMLNKPIQVLSTVKDPQGRTTVLDCLPGKFRQKRLYPVGRLDYFSEGLLLLTDDGALTQLLMHPRYHLPRSYRLRVREKAEAHMLDKMRRGMILSEGETLLPARVELVDPHTLHITLRQGVNRQIRRMCRDLGLTILFLQRFGFGPLRLGDLSKGDCRTLEDVEVAALKSAAGA
ncbi:MAG: rRNA pseudouridine synthase [Desulfovibrio sp.]|jgi:23S rRNA pseudouridine2605 synthase|nr:rRNA pseudouridine synthase [Desulfovibrio sp.]